MGKIVLRIDGQSQVKVCASILFRRYYTDSIKVQPRPYSPPSLTGQYTYLVAGGLGGIGREVIKHLVKLGATNIVTLSPSGAADGIKKAFVEEMKQKGVNLVVHQGSVANIEDVRKVKELVGDQTIRGIIQAAMSLQVIDSKNSSPLTDANEKNRIQRLRV